MYFQSNWKDFSVALATTILLQQVALVSSRPAPPEAVPTDFFHAGVAEEVNSAVVERAKIMRAR